MDSLVVDVYASISRKYTTKCIVVAAGNDWLCRFCFMTIWWTRWIRSGGKIKLRYSYSVLSRECERRHCRVLCEQENWLYRLYETRARHSVSVVRLAAISFRDRLLEHERMANGDNDESACNILRQIVFRWLDDRDTAVWIKTEFPFYCV